MVRVHFDAPSHMRDQCVVCSTVRSHINPVVAHTAHCEYRPRAKDAHRGAKGGDATIVFSLCQQHNDAAKGVKLCGWDWWDIIEAL